MRRVATIGKMLLNGTSLTEMCRYAARRWGVGDREVDRYVAKAREAIKAQTAAELEDWRALHIKRREELFEKCVKAGQHVPALMMLQDEAKLLGLYEQRAADDSKALNELVTALRTGTQKVIDGAGDEPQTGDAPA